MKRLIIRHGYTGVKRDSRIAYGIQGPPLNIIGKEQAIDLKLKLIKLGFDPSDESVAVSELRRTQHTAELAGFVHTKVYKILNEVKTGLPADEVKSMLEIRQVPEEAVRRAKIILENPPKETVWILHGLLIVGLCAVLGVERKPFVPDFCEISFLDI